MSHKREDLEKLIISKEELIEMLLKQQKKPKKQKVVIVDDIEPVQEKKPVPQSRVGKWAIPTPSNFRPTCTEKERKTNGR